MRDYIEKKISKEFEHIYKSKCLNGKKIFLFGAGDYSRFIANLIRNKNMNIEAIIDNDISKQSGFCAGCRIISINESLDLSDTDRIYIVCSDFYKEMTAQLYSNGVKKKQIIVFKSKHKSLISAIISANNGRKIYNNIINKYGNVKIFLCPYTGTGDIYLIGSLWEQFVQYHNIQKYVFIVLSKPCYRVTKLFPIKNVLLLENMKDAEYLISYYLFCNSNLPLVILNDGWRELPYSSTEWLRGYKGLYFTQLFKKYVFNLPDNIRPKHPNCSEIPDSIKNLFKENSLIPGKTIVLSPYSNTLFDLPESFWLTLVKLLKERNYTLCTNCGSSNETAILGTKKIFVFLDKAPQFINYAGYFVGVRSGFCDIISGTDAKKVIMYYEKNRFYNTMAFEYFNLKGMELCDNALELCFSKENMDSIISKIMEWF